MEASPELSPVSLSFRERSWCGTLGERLLLSGACGPSGGCQGSVVSLPVVSFKTVREWLKQNENPAFVFLVTPCRILPRLSGGGIGVASQM